MRLHGRRGGVTMVLVAILMTVLLGMAAMAFDLSRFFVMRSQLQTVADASALAGAVELARDRIDQAVDTAVHYARLNRVERNLASVAPADVELGLWDYAAGVFSPVAPEDWSTSAVNAVRVNAHYTGATTFGRIFDFASASLNTQAIGAVGYVGTTSCLKPWAVSYADLLRALFPGETPDVNRPFTAADADSLGKLEPLASITMLLGGSNQYTPGNIGQVKVNEPWNGNSSYKDAIVGSCSNMQVGPGTMLDAAPGAGSGQSTKSVADLCGVHGNPSSFACNVKIKLAVWDTNTGASGSNLQFHVKFVGAFVITNYTKTNGQNASEQITGYFSTMESSGSFSSNPTPLVGMVALVK